MKKYFRIVQSAWSHPIAIVAWVAIVVRLIVAFSYQHITLYPDSGGYIELAQRLSHFNLTGYEGQRSPGYAILLALVGNTHLWVALAQMAIGVLTLMLFYKTMRRITDKTNLSLLVTLLVSLYIPGVFFELAILSETLTLFTISIIFYNLFIISYNRAKKKHYWAIILACAYLVLIKPFYIFLPFILCFILLAQRKKWKLNLYPLIMLPTLSLVVFGAWSYTNKVNTGYCTPTTFHGFNLAQNCVRFAEHTTDEYRNIGSIYAQYRDSNIEKDRGIAMSIWEAQTALEEETKLSFPDLSDTLYKYSMATIQQNPLLYIKQVAISWIDFWKTSFYYQQNDFKYPQFGNMIIQSGNAQRIALQLIKCLFVLLIPFNIVLALRKKRISIPVLLSVVILIASLLQALATYGTNSRFSYPFELLIIISVVINWQEWMSLRRRKKG